MKTPTRKGPLERIPRDPYRRPPAVRPDALLLDGNEGSLPDPALLGALATADPDVLREYPRTDALAADLAARIGVASEQIVVTAGADDALDRVCRSFLEPGRSVVIPLPAFEMLRRFVALTGAEVIPVAWDEAFPVEETLGAVRDDTALIVVTSPNNPTGQVISAEELDRLARGAGDCTILLDLAYGEYADVDLTGPALQYPNVVVVRTLSKAWGLAGARVGYAVATPDTAEVLRSSGNPYPVSALSLAVARSWLATGQGELDRHVDSVRRQRSELTELLGRHGIPTSRSEANFVFPRLGKRAAFAYGALQALGIVTRRFPHRPEIADGIRISLPGNDSGMSRLQTALETVLAPDTVLLDLDGVLADVSESYRNCVMLVAESYGITLDVEDVARAKRAGDANNDWVLTRRLLAERGVEASLEEVIDRYQVFYLGNGSGEPLRERERLIPSVDAVRALKGSRKLAVVTGRPRDEAAWFLEREGIAQIIDALVCMEDAPAKPNPAPVLLAMQMLQSERAWMVGDTPDDIRAARDAGVVPIGIVAPGDDPAPTTRALEDAGAALVISDISELARLLP